MGREELLTLRVEDIPRRLTTEEVIHIATALGAFWTYDYVAAKKGRVGKHVLLKSGLHSDGFFISKILLEPENIKNILSYQIVIRLSETDIFVPLPDYVAGVPDGATALAYNVAEIIGARKAHMGKNKINGHIFLTTEIPNGATLLLIEDFCTRGTGFSETVLEVKNKQPFVKLLPYNPVIINRGGLKEIFIDGVGNFSILPIVEQRIKDWDPTENCPLCNLGSVSIKPKMSEENWQLLTTSQL